MSEELSGRELTRAAYLAAGVEIKLLRDSFTKVAVWPDGTLLSYGESTEEKLWRRAPDAASKIAAAWPLLEKWREKTGGKTSISTVQGGWIVVLRWGKQLEQVVRGSRLGFDASSAPTAICRALVAAAEETL